LEFKGSSSRVWTFAVDVAVISRQKLVQTTSTENNPGKGDMEKISNLY
jgi:hypothetical protein